MTVCGRRSPQPSYSSNPCRVTAAETRSRTGSSRPASSTQVLTEKTARRAAELRRRSQHGSAVDAVVGALAKPRGTVLTGDKADFAALAAHAHGVTVETI